MHLLSRTFLLFLLLLFAWSGDVMSETPGGVITDHEFSAGGMIYTNGATGFGLSLQYGHRQSAVQYNIFSANIYMLKHPKEVRSITNVIEDARPFIYGKINTIPAIRFTWGKNRILTRQYEHNDVLVEFTYQGGVTIGLQKPVYIKVFEGHSDNMSLETVQFDPEKHSSENIYGGAGFLEGIEETRPRIGAGLKSGIAFRWNNDNNRYRRLETGVKVDAFHSEIPIFATIENKQIFLNLYLEYSIGRNW